MDLARTVYSRELKISVMRSIDAGETVGQAARRMQLSPKLLEKWRGEWRARGEAAFPGKGNRPSTPITDERRLAELERKIGEMTMENDFLKKALAHFRENHPPAVVSGAVACARKSKKRPKREGL
ncbi:MAG: transposase [Candidatus Sulfotelmatobacter sp.]